VPGEARLVAYIVPDNTPAPSLADLRRLVRAHLPEYMVPSAVVVLQSLPRTATGQVDAKALPAPVQERPPLDQSYVEPRNQVEKQLQTIWEQVLQIRPVGVKDPFSELGGDSLQAAHLCLQIQKALEKTVPLWPPLQDV